MASLVLFLAPSAALADNECGVQIGTTHVICDQTSYGDGVTYDAIGDLFIDFTASPTTEIESGGIDLSATGGDDITFDSASTNTEIESRAVTGPLLSVTTVNGDIDIDTEEMDADGQTPQGVTHAIYAESTGSGSIDINTTGNVDAAGSSNPSDSIGIEAITGSGNLTITVVSGDVTGNTAIDATTDTGLLAINNTGRIQGGSGLAIRASGDTLTLNNDGVIRGAMDFSDVENGYTFDNNGAWTGVLNSVLGAGVLNNAGRIDFRTDGALQVVSAVGTAFTGTGDSRLDMRVGLNGVGQTGCSVATRVASCMDLSGGSTDGRTSIDVSVGFSTLVTGPLTALTSATPDIVLVDVSGGTSHAGDFVLDPASSHYAADPVYGGVIDTSEFTKISGDRTLDVAGGILDYALLYNPDTQQHVLASVPQREAVEYVTAIQQALSVWHTTSDTVAGRQADVRDGATGKLWFRLTGGQSERDAAPTSTIAGNRFTYDQDYSIYTAAAIVGFDASVGDNHVIGFHGGVVSSETHFDDSSSDDEIQGGVVGLYGGWWNDSGLSLDGTFNVNSVTLGRDVPGFEDSDSDVRSIGARAEAGWRLPVLGEALYVQPLAAATYVKANFDKIELRDNTIGFEDTTSTRAALGARVGGETDMNGGKVGKVGYWLTARAWEEYADDGEIRFAMNNGDYLAIEDDRSGSFEEVNFGVNVSNQDDTLSGYLSAGATFGDNVDTYNFSIGARLNW